MITLRSVFAALLICRTAIVDARKHPPWFQTCTQTAHVLIALTPKRQLQLLDALFVATGAHICASNAAVYLCSSPCLRVCCNLSCCIKCSSKTSIMCAAGRSSSLETHAVLSTSRSLLSYAPQSAAAPNGAPAPGPGSVTEAPRTAPAAAAAPSHSGRRSLLTNTSPAPTPYAAHAPAAAPYRAPAPASWSHTEAPNSAPAGVAAPSHGKKRSLLSYASYPAPAPYGLPASHTATAPAPWSHTEAPTTAPAGKGAPSI